MSSLSDNQVVTASGGLVELGYSQITSDVNVVSTTAGAGTEIIAPLTVVCDGGPVLVEFFTPEVRTPSVSSQMIRASLYQDGAEHTRYWGTKRTVAAVVDLAPMQLQRRLTPTAGSHTFGVKAFVDSTSGTPSVAAGDGTSAAHAPAFLRVSKIVQATQWPAVTTGTIICTSTTRPSAPFVGQQIYETDTGLNYQWTGAAWTQRTGDLTAWTAPTLLNSWVNFGGTFQTTRYMKDSNGIVHIEGLVKNGVMQNAAFTLPVGHRPAAGLITAQISNNAIGRVDLDTYGNVTPGYAGTNAWMTLNVSFRAA